MFKQPAIMAHHGRIREFFHALTTSYVSLVPMDDHCNKHYCSGALVNKGQRVRRRALALVSQPRDLAVLRMMAVTCPPN